MNRRVEARGWEAFEPGFAALLKGELTVDDVEGWLQRWSERMKEVHEQQTVGELMRFVFEQR